MTGSRSRLSKLRRLRGARSVLIYDLIVDSRAEYFKLLLEFHDEVLEKEYVVTVDGVDVDGMPMPAEAFGWPRSARLAAPYVYIGPNASLGIHPLTALKVSGDPRSMRFTIMPWAPPLATPRTKFGAIAVSQDVVINGTTHSQRRFVTGREEKYPNG